MLQVSVVLSIVLGFLSSEFLGLLSGGMVSAGYLAFYLEQPLRVASTLLMSVAICLLVKLLQRYIILFGRRRFMLTVILGILLSMLLERSLVLFAGIDQDFRLIGYIITGLIANDMVKQGIIKTLVMVLMIAIVIWLVIHLGAF
ncbi:MAG: poly-gamma-glutamate biosynthesis protein PgsC [Sphaerochaetaceae bacterium]|jgi:poly-gamma-glutamate biosynthesis protein PgsC/CapC|nr:poly-gamma-glutamate biosynthesis protein PgsC [Sphaerochaetaceae bacterium]